MQFYLQVEEMSQVQMDLMLFSFLYAIKNWPNKIFWTWDSIISFALCNTMPNLFGLFMIIGKTSQEIIWVNSDIPILGYIYI